MSKDLFRPYGFDENGVLDCNFGMCGIGNALLPAHERRCAAQGQMEDWTNADRDSRINMLRVLGSCHCAEGLSIIYNIPYEV